MNSSDGFPQVEILIEPFQTHVFSARILQVVCLLASHPNLSWNQMRDWLQRLDSLRMSYENVAA